VSKIGSYWHVNKRGIARGIGRNWHVNRQELGEELRGIGSYWHVNRQELGKESSDELAANGTSIIEESREELAAMARQ
jgi:hypothetical protein